MNSTHHTTSRRDFLATGLKTTLGVCALNTLHPFCSPAADAAVPGSKVRFGFTSYQWGKDWDLSTIIANLTKAQVFGVELRTSASYAHGVELSLSAEKRQEVKKRFADSPITVVGIASAECLDWPEPEKLKAAIEAAKAHLKLSRDVGASGVRVFPNQWHPNVPHEKTIQLQINLLVKMNWDGWGLLEASDKVPDRVQALIEQRQLWEQMVAKAVRG